MEIFFKKKIFLIVLIFNYGLGYSQSDWVNYLLKKDKGLMSVHIDLSLNNSRPNYSNLLIVGTKFSGCLKNGFPTEEGLDKLYTFSDSLALAVKKITNSKLAGIITYQCYGFDVYYVKDTINLRKEIDRMIDNNHSPRSKEHIVIESDRNWNYYYNNMFPTNAPNDFFIDHQYLLDMVSQGDDLKGKRDITHWLKFKKEKKRINFIDEAKLLRFNIDSLYMGKEEHYPYEIQISRKDYITPKAVYNLTRLLKMNLI